MADAQSEGPHYERTAKGVGERPKSKKPSKAAKAVKRYGRLKYSARGLTLVTLPPAWQRAAPGELHHGGARLFAARAAKAGYEVAARCAGDAEQVGVKAKDRDAILMRATWTAGTSRGVIVGSSLLGVKAAQTLL